MRLTADTVRAIHAEYATRQLSQARVAANYGVSSSEVKEIVTGKIWRHLGLAPIPTRPDFHAFGNPKGDSHIQSKLTSTAVLEIRRRWAAGETPTQLAKEYGVCRPLVSMVVHRKAWTHI